MAIGNSFNDDERCVLAGYDNGDVKLFDLRTNKVCVGWVCCHLKHAGLCVQGGAAVALASDGGVPMGCCAQPTA